VGLTIFSDTDMKKNIKARVFLSDGCSKLTCMVGDKIFSSIVSNFAVILLVEPQTRKF
jgi:hypothetical protein